MSEQRTCAACGKELTRREGERSDNWAKRRTCSKGCKAALHSATKAAKRAAQERRGAKRCCRCGEEKSLSMFWKHRNGRRARCSDCLKSESHQRYWVDLEARRAYQRAWANRHPETTRARYKRWHAANQEHRLAYYRNYNNRNRELKRERDRQRREAMTPEQRRAKWRRENKAAAARGYYRLYRAENRGRINEREAEWRRKNPNKNNEPERRRYRAKRDRAGGVLVSVSELRAMYGNVCYLCDASLNRYSFTMDHVIPLARGGAHSISNLRPCCGRCNSRKGARLWRELMVSYPEMAQRVQKEVDRSMLE